MTELVSVDWTPRTRLIASFAIAFHLLCVFVGPWSNPPPSTQLSRDVGSLLSPYIKFAALDNGYRFFAPDPGPSHLVRYELQFPDGTKQSGQFPDRNKHWPRLLYHRFFMLSESLFTMASPVLDAPPLTTMTAAEQQTFKRHQRQVELLQEGVAHFLLSQDPNATKVRLFTRIHEVPQTGDVVNGQPLDDPSLYQEFLLGEYKR